MTKIARVALSIFGLTGSATDFGKFGSEEAGSGVKTKDIALIQSLAAWGTGLGAAIYPGNKAPYMEDVNAALYVHSYQTAYILQEGIPEWDGSTTYFTGSIVKKTGTAELYSSIGDTNLNHTLPSAATDTYWLFLGNIGNIYAYMNQAVKDTSTPTFAAATINGNITVTGTVDGIDISACINQAVLTTSMPTFANSVINGFTWSNTINQYLLSTSSPTFNNLTINGNITMASSQKITLSTDGISHIQYDNSFGIQLYSINGYRFQFGGVAFTNYNGLDLGTAGYRWGVVYCTAVNQSSDRNIKKNIVNVATAGLCDKLVAPVTYNFKTEPDTDRKHFGIIAQDAPDEVAAEDKCSVELLAYIAYLQGCVVELRDRVKVLEVK